MKQLALLNGDTIVKRFTLDRDMYSIGRSKETDFTFDHPKVSRNHARLYRENGEYFIQDLNSTNYVFVNGLRVKKKQLFPNDRVQISSEVNLLFLETTPEPIDKQHTLMDIQKHFIHKDDLVRLKKVTQSVVLLNRLDNILLQILKEGIALTNAERGLIVLTDGNENILWKYATTYRIDKIQAELGAADVSHSILQEAIESKTTVVRANEALKSETATVAVPPAPQQPAPAPQSAQSQLSSQEQHPVQHPTQAAAPSGESASAQVTSLADSMMSLKIFSAMCAPLVLEDKVIGLFYVDARQVMNNFSEVDQFLFDYLADHAAIAIFNSKRYADQQLEVQRSEDALQALQAEHDQLKQQYQELMDLQKTAQAIGAAMISEKTAGAVAPSEDAPEQPVVSPEASVSATTSAGAAEPSQGAVSPQVRHTYSAGGVVLNPRGQLLVVNQHHSSWSLPKGHIEAGEEPAVAAQREIFEESGVSYLHMVQSLGSYHRRALDRQGQENPLEMKTIYIYLFHTEQENLNPQDSDNPEARWVSIDEALQLLSHPKDRSFLSQAWPQVEAYLARRAQG